jgi:hypothetical protein
MSFENYVGEALSAGGTFRSGKELTAKFEEYLKLRYPDWDGLEKPRQAARYAEELAKAPREYEVITTGPAAAARHCARNLAGIERRYVDDLNLLSVFNDGAQVRRYAVANPVIKAETWVHIFEGNESGSGGNQTHTGLHWLGKFNSGNHSSKKRRNQIEVNVTAHESTLGLFKATVKVWSKPKVSTFFPDSWNQEEIEKLVRDAARFWIARGPGAGEKVRSNRGLVKWAGKVLKKDGGGGWKPLWIGGLGDPGAAAGVTTAFPEFGGNFEP